MNLHEYQAKTLFRNAGIAIPEGQRIEELSQLDAVLDKIDSECWVVKAQIHAGARGKAGGVKLVKTRQEARKEAKRLLGSSLATIQTAGKKLPINSLLIEETLNIKTELYLSLNIDRELNCYAFILSEAGGMDIESVARKNPEKIFTVPIDPLVGIMPYQCREVGCALELTGTAFKQLSEMMMALYKLAIQQDISMLEINPLVVTNENHLVALDAKMVIDSNALYRHCDLVQMQDLTQEDPYEILAAQHQLSYISLDGNIGCMVNGAGLAMATMDLIKLYGGRPANFLDVGGGATPDRVAEAFKLILSSPKVTAILVNIFGGIVRCDLIAQGILLAINEVRLTIPVIVRLEGTNVKAGKALLENSELEIITADSLPHAAQQAVQHGQKEK